MKKTSRRISFLFVLLTGLLMAVLAVTAACGGGGTYAIGLDRDSVSMKVGDVITLVAEVTLHIAVQKVHGLHQLIPSLSLGAGIQQRVDGVEQLLMLTVNQSVSGNQIWRQFIFHCQCSPLLFSIDRHSLPLLK